MLRENDLNTKVAPQPPARLACAETPEGWRHRDVAGTTDTKF